MDLIHRKSDEEVKDESQLSIVDEFLSIINQSAEFIEKCSQLEDEQKRNLYFRLLYKIEESVQTGDMTRFAKLNEVISHLKDTDKNAALPESTSFSVLACQYNKLDILKHLLDKEKQVHNKIFDIDAAGNTAYYYAIRSNNVKLLETLIESANLRPTILYDSLSKDYALLKLKNVYIHETMRIFVEDRLLRERYLCAIINERDAPKSKLDNTPNTLTSERYKRLNIIVNVATIWNDIRSSFQDYGVSFALDIATNIRVLKGQLESTYSLLPWEEMEFCLSRYLFLQPAEKNRILRHLNKFVIRIKNVFGINAKSDTNEIDVKARIEEYAKKKSTDDRKKIDDFEALYDDYELMKDEYSLKKMLRYTQLALSVNPDEQSGQLIIQRALHVIGEYAKNSLKSPHLSQTAQDTFMCNLGNSIDVASSLRNAFSHMEKMHRICTRNSIETQEGFFKKLQEDLKRVIRVIVHICCSVEIKRFKKWCLEIIHENNAHQFDELCEGFCTYLREIEFPKVDDPAINALNRVTELLKMIRNTIDKNQTGSLESDIEAVVLEIEEINETEKNKISKSLKNLNETFQFKKQEVFSHLMDRKYYELDYKTADKAVVMERSKSFFKYIFKAFDIPSNFEGLEKSIKISELTTRISGNVKVRRKYHKVAGIMNAISWLLYFKPYYFVTTEIEAFKDILEFTPSDQDGDTEIELDNALEMLKKVPGIDKVSEKFQLTLNEKKVIHELKLKVNTCKEQNPVQLRSEEESLVNKKVLSEIKIGEDLLKKIPDHYGDFLEGRTEEKERKSGFPKLTGSFLLKSVDEKSKLKAIFEKIKSEHNSFIPVTVFNEKFQEIKESLPERYNNLMGTLEKIQHNHESRKTLLDFFNRETKLQKEQYEKLVSSLSTGATAKKKLQNLYKLIDSNINELVEVVMESMDDAYGDLVNVLKNKESSAKKICGAYVLFLNSLQLDHQSTELLKKAIIKNKVFSIIDDQFSKKLNLLKEILGNVRTRQSKYTLISRYRRDDNLQAMVEMLLFDLCNVTMIAHDLESEFKFVVTCGEIPLDFLSKGFLYLAEKNSSWTRNALRNYLAHGDVLIDSLPFDSSIAIISSAILISEEAESLIALRDIVKDGIMVKNLINQNRNFADSSLSKNFPSDTQINIKSLVTFQRSNYWKFYLKIMPEDPLLEIDICNCYEQYFNQCISQMSLFVAATKGDHQNLKGLLRSGEDIHSRDINMHSLLHVAANKGHNNTVEFLLNNGINVNVTNKFHETSLHLAARNGHYLVVETLLKYGAKVYALDEQGCTPLHHAVLLKGVKELAITLLKHGADCDARSSYGTPLHYAVGYGDLDVIKLLVEQHKANISIEDNTDSNLLPVAATRRDNATEVFEYLLNKYCSNVTWETSVENTGLRIAVCSGNTAVVKILFKQEAIKNMSRSTIDSLLWDAVKNGHVTIVEMLLNNGANMTGEIFKVRSALHIASMHGHSCLVKFFHEKLSVKMPDVCGLTDHDGRIPLHYAALFGALDTVRYLVENGNSNVNRPAEDGTTPLYVAVSLNHFKVVRYLVEQNANVETVDKSGNSLLHVWANNEFNDSEIAEYLINDKSIEVDVVNIKGHTPLALACAKGTWYAIKYLVDKKGARVDIPFKNGRNLLNTAVIHGDLHLLEYLIEKMSIKTDKTILNFPNVTFLIGHPNIAKALLKVERNFELFVDSYIENELQLLRCAIIRGNTPLVELLINAKVNTEQNPDYGSLLGIAVQHSSEKIVKILLNNGANRNDTSYAGITPLIIAIAMDKVEMIEILLNNGANINLANNEGSTTPLHVAIEYGMYNSAKVLVKRGANVDAVDHKRWMPLQHAIYKSNWNIYKLLVMKMIENTEMRNRDEQYSIKNVFIMTFGLNN